MFDIHNGKAIFNGGFVEVVNKDNLVSVLATSEGSNSLQNFVINSKDSIPAVINSLKFAPLTKTSIPMAMPVPVAVTYGEPLTSPGKLKIENAIPMPTSVRVTEEVIFPSREQSQGNSNEEEQKIDPDKKPGKKEKNKDQNKNKKKEDDKDKEQKKEDQKELSGLEASYELARIAKDQKVDLISLAKDEYSIFAYNNKIGLDRAELIQSPALRTAISEEQYIAIRNELEARTEKSSAYQPFYDFSTEIKAKVIDANPVELESGIKILPKSKKAND
jgi:hypothetical protein